METLLKGTTHGVAELICSTSYEQLPSEVVDYSKALALSSLGAMVAGSTTPAGRMVAQYVDRMGGHSEATVAATGLRSSAENAALANGTFIHATEYEDDSMPEAVSAGTLFPALLALGELLRTPGRSVLEAFVAGYEAQARLGIDCYQAMKRGYLNLSLVGVLGVAAAATKLLGLDVYRTKMALGLAASQSGGLLRQIGSMAHYLEMGLPGRDGLAAALLAADGFTADSDVLEGPQGFCELMTAGRVREPHDAAVNWGNPWRVMQVGIKRYPCCYQLLRTIDGVLELKREHGFRANDVDMVQFGVRPSFAELIRYPEPANGEEAKFSLPHSVAVALLDDEITVDSFSDERARDEAYRAIGRRVGVAVHDEWEGGPSSGTIPLTITLKDGRRYSTECATFVGQPPDLLAREQVESKYELCTRGLLASERIEESMRLTLQMERLDDVGKLMDAVAFPLRSAGLREYKLAS